MKVYIVDWVVYHGGLHGSVSTHRRHAICHTRELAEQLVEDLEDAAAVLRQRTEPTIREEEVIIDGRPT